MKKIIFIIIALLVATAVVVISKGKLQDKGNLMDNTNTYTVIAPNGMEIPFDKKTNLMIPNNDNYKNGELNISKSIIPPRLVGRLATTIVMENGLYIG